MEKQDKRRTSANVSCRNIAWYFDLCDEKKLDSPSILRNVEYSKEYLSDPSNFIDWQKFAVLNDNLLQYLSDVEMREAGRRSWNNGNLRHYKIVSTLNHSVPDQYSSVFGPTGFMAKLYPCDLNISETKKSHFVVQLRMKNELFASRSFHLILAGQLMGLPEVLGQQSASVEIEHTKKGADFTVYHEKIFGFSRSLKQLYGQYKNRKVAALELNQNYNALQEKYRQLFLANKMLEASQDRVTSANTRYELLSNNIADVIWTTDLQLNLLYISPSFEKLTGHKIDDSINKPINKFFTNQSIDLINDGLKMALSGKEAIKDEYVFEAQLVRKNNSTICAEVKAKIEFNIHDIPIKIIGVTRDISERKSMEELLTRSEKKYRLITNTAQDAIITFDENGRITFANPSAAQTFDYSLDDLVGLPIKLIIPDIFRASPLEIDQLIETNIQLAGLTKNNDHLSLEISFAKHEKNNQSFYTGISRDIGQGKRHDEERKKLETQLLASQKLESIGKLTAGIAHDFNNLLVAINGYAELGINKNNNETDIRHYFSEIKRAGKSAALMTKKLLAFSRKQVQEPTVSNLPALLESLQPMIQRLLPTNIDVTFDIEISKLNVLIDSTQLEQVIINLIVNAGDAMPKGGKLNITNRQVMLDESLLCANSLAVGNYNIVTISDTGQGMSMRTRNKIFEPLFTTKPEGSGTGLGLTVVHGIISKHNGLIQIESELGKGSVFSFYLPCSDRELGAPLAREASNDMSGSESILVVDDNVQVRELVCTLLESIGYKVQTAIDGLAALEYFHFNQKDIDLVIMDVVMPRMGGQEVYKRMREINSNVKVIFTSGYSSEGLHTKFIHENKLEFIQKPYHNELLKSRIRKTLDEIPTLSSVPDYT
ncbi:MAG: PAS domain S-box-containing protein [Flavobacterium sp.]|jgi:PAS domain S-box-containing protein